MRIVLQRVSRARVTVGEDTAGEIGPGLVLLVGVEDSDGRPEVDAAAGKISGLRIFPDSADLMNRSIMDVEGGILVVSQFTLLGDVRKGRRPSFAAAGRPGHAESVVNQLIEAFRARGLETGSGEFGARMEVEMVNDGPVTMVLQIRDGRVA
jgi:D-aminoacyl-tRNA deacylase